MQELPDSISKAQIDNIISSVGEEIAESLLEEVFQFFSEDSAVSIKKFNQYFDQGDLVQLQKTAHHLKGAAMNLGMDSISSICIKLEKFSGDLPCPKVRVLLDDLFGQLEIVNEWISTAFQ
jgi:HPt (histidine-containing phosphotransfer) domain-containing protein